jgi:hypothetical protein
MSRSFTIVSIIKPSGSKLQYSGGRFMSESPSGAAKKMFSQGRQHCRDKCISFKITLRETTQGSNHKEYTYRVKRVKDPVEIEYKNGDVVVHEFTTKIKSLN